MVFNGPSIYPNLMFFVFSIKSVEDIYDFLSILAAVDEISLDSCRQAILIMSG